MVAKQQASLTLIHYNLGKLPESVQTSSSFFFFLVSLCGLQDLSSLTRDLTWALEMLSQLRETQVNMCCETLCK